MKTKLLCLIIGLQLAWALSTVATQELRLRRAPTVLLETAPVDPRDLLRGDYVILGYKISRLPRDLFQPPFEGGLPPGARVYVTLEQRGEFHEAVAASLVRPEPAEGVRVISGTVDPQWMRIGGAGSDFFPVVYGIERYYVAEGTGNPTGTLTVEVSVSRSGSATIRQVFLDGRPYREAMREQQAPAP